jgi:hypothetical protein
MPGSVADGSPTRRARPAHPTRARELRDLDNPIGVELDELRKSVLLPSAGRGTQNVERARIPRIRQHLDRMTHSGEIEPPGLSR